MDAGHRHELKTNELAEQLGHLPQLIKENSNVIIGVVLIAAGLITWPMFTRMSRQRDVAAQSSVTQSIQTLDQNVYDVLQAAEGDAEAKNKALSTLLVNADALLGQASDIDNPNLAALARIKAAQAIRTELHLRPDVSAEMLETQTQKARAAYEQAAEAAGTPELKAMAKFGLGLCAEELGQTTQAADIYKGIIADKTFEATALPKQAQQRLDGLADNSQVFTFAPSPADVLPAEDTEALETATETTSVIEAAPQPVLDGPAAKASDAEQTVPTGDSTPQQPATEP
ncbi:MAG: hypothetical protein L0Y36_03200 [Planctomycetales bacterium]|nr:hypothetical protein [Planctomycetales bacterium]